MIALHVRGTQRHTDSTELSWCADRSSVPASFATNWPAYSRLARFFSESQIASTQRAADLLADGPGALLLLLGRRS